MSRSKLSRLLGGVAAIPLVALAVTGCGGGNGTSSNSPAGSASEQSPAAAVPAQTPVAAPPKPSPVKASPSPKASPPPAATPSPAQSSSGIPQGDVGDNDADNHGGPDDGDGGI
jgi:hypothetical protein